MRYDRLGSKTHPRFPHPIDHYVLFEGVMASDQPRGKLMDFYVYGYADNPHPDDDLPAGLTVIKMSKEFDQKMQEMIEKSPELKRVFDDRMLLQINMARLQRGLAPLDQLPQKGSCLVVAFALLVGCSGLAYKFATLLV